MQMGKVCKDFKVVAVSSNANSFGLRGMVLVARDGEAWEVGASHLNVRPVGETIHVEIEVDPKTHERTGLAWQFEIPRELPKPPQKAVGDLWRQ